MERNGNGLKWLDINGNDCKILEITGHVKIYDAAALASLEMSWRCDFRIPFQNGHALLSRHQLGATSPKVTRSRALELFYHIYVKKKQKKTGETYLQCCLGLQILFPLYTRASSRGLLANSGIKRLYLFCVHFLCLKGNT